MRLLKHILDFYINSSIHVALAVFALAWISLKEFYIQYDKALLYFIFFAAIIGYNFAKYFGVVKWHHRQYTNWLKAIQLFSLCCFVLMCYYALQLHFNTLVLVVIFGIINFLYAIPFWSRKLYLDSNQNLRSISGLKIYIIAFVWAGVTVILPLINNELGINIDAVVTFFQRFIFVFVLMLPFEIRDLRYDSLKLATIPQKIGIKNTKILGIILLIVFLLLEFFKDEISSLGIVIMLIITTVTMIFIVFSRKKQGKFYSAFFVEGLPILWMLLWNYLD